MHVKPFMILYRTSKLTMTKSVYFGNQGKKVIFPDIKQATKSTNLSVNVQRNMHVCDFPICVCEKERWRWHWVKVNDLIVAQLMSNVTHLIHSCINNMQFHHSDFSFLSFLIAVSVSLLTLNCSDCRMFNWQDIHLYFHFPFTFHWLSLSGSRTRKWWKHSF